MKNKINTEDIIEIYPGHFQRILDFPDKSIISRILDMSWKYVWCIRHEEIRTEWTEYEGSIFGLKQPSEEIQVIAREMSMDLLLESTDFVQFIPKIGQSVKLVQVQSIPPYYQSPVRVRGATWYDMLANETDYLFEIDLPGAADYTPIVSRNRSFLELL